MEKNDLNRDSEAILNVIATESTAFWNKDFEAWAQCWVHASYIRLLGWYPAGGVSYQARWDTISAHAREQWLENPVPNPNAFKVRREDFNVRIYGDSAWVTFDQYGVDTGEVTFDMPGLSRETRILEKQNGQWKFVSVGYLLEGNK